jgi:hypothetical protein
MSENHDLHWFSVKSQTNEAAKRGLNVYHDDCVFITQSEFAREQMEAGLHHRAQRGIGVSSMTDAVQTKDHL